MNFRQEMLKAWKRLLKYIRSKLVDSKKSFEKSGEGELRYSQMMIHLDGLDKQWKDNGVMTDLHRLINIEKVEKNNAEELLTPNKRIREVDAVRMWFQSEVNKEEEAKIETIWSRAMTAGKEDLSNQDFVSVANYARFTVLLTSKNRPGVYKSLLNKDYLRRQKLWIPNEALETFDGDVEDWTTPPKDEPNKPPNYWIIKLAGGGAHLKSQEATTIVLNKKAEELMQKYRELKDIMWPDLDGSKKFFVNFHGEPLGPMTRTPGTLMAKFKEVTGLDDICPTTVRRGAEAKIVGNSAAASRVKELQNHSSSTGQGAYNKTSPLVRARYFGHVSLQEGSNEVNSNSKISAEIQKKRREIAEKDLQNARREAQKVLEKYQANRQASSKTKVQYSDRLVLQELCSNEENKEMFEATQNKMFPKPSVFKKLFYRMVDGGAATNEELVEVEKRVFTSIKKKVEEVFDREWDNSPEMNKLADKKVSEAIRNSFMSYEKTRKEFQKSYFKFYI